MKKLLLVISSIFGSIGSVNAQILPFVEVPDSLNPFLDILYNKIEIEDIDGDGYEEVVFYTYPMEGQIFKNNGDGTFEIEELIDSPLSSIFEYGIDQGGYGFDIEFADLDGDGDSDIGFNYFVNVFSAFCEYGCSEGRLRLFRNNIDNLEALGLGPNVIGFHDSSDFVDLDLDGDKDLLLNKGQEDKYGNAWVNDHSKVLWNFDDQTFNSEEDLNSFQGYSLDFSHFDIDGDGDDDAFFRSIYFNSSGFLWNKHTGPNEYLPPTEAPINFLQEINYFKNFDLGDLDNDGYSEIILWDQIDHRMRFFEQECIQGLNGETCNDGLLCTSNDAFDENCNCIGIELDSDNDGVCDPLDLCPGDDFLDTDGDGICDGLDQTIGDCDFGAFCGDSECDEFYIYDQYCNCIGVAQADADNDGICDLEDQCPGENDTIDDNNDGIPDCLQPNGVVEILASQFKIYPNPSTGIFHFETSLLVENISLFSSLGKTLELPKNNLSNIDLSTFSIGMYHIEVKTNKGIIRKKIILQK